MDAANREIALLTSAEIERCSRQLILANWGEREQLRARNSRAIVSADLASAALYLSGLGIGCIALEWTADPDANYDLARGTLGRRCEIIQSSLNEWGSADLALMQQEHPLFPALAALGSVPLLATVQHNPPLIVLREFGAQPVLVPLDAADSSPALTLSIVPEAACVLACADWLARKARN